MADTTISPNPALPLRITVDLQSLHATGFRLFTRDGAGGEWVFFKSGHADTTAVLPPPISGGGVLAEFAFTPMPGADFRTVLAFEQNGSVLPDGAVAVGAKGDAVLVQHEVAFA